MSAQALASSQTETYPVSSTQASLWAPSGSSAINVPAVLRLRGPLEQARLAETLAALVGRHGALRTTLHSAPDGTPVQRVTAGGTLALDILRHDATLPQALPGLLLAGSERPFALAGEPLARAELHAFGAQDHLLMLWSHHIISDLASANVLVEEFKKLYAGEALGAVQCQLAEFAIAERAARASTEQRRFWTDNLRGADGRFAMPAVTSDQHLAIRPALPLLPPPVAQSLSRLAAARRTTLIAVFAAAVIANHASAAATDRALIGLTMSNRDSARLRSTVGCLADQLPLVVDIDGDPTFGELLDRVRAALLDAYDHRLPLGVLRQFLTDQQPPMFAVNLNFLPPRASIDPPVTTGRVRIEDVRFPYGIVKSRPDPWWAGDAVLAYRPRLDPAGLGGEIEGDATIHDFSTVAGHGQRFAALLEQASQTLDIPLSRLAEAR